MRPVGAALVGVVLLTFVGSACRDGSAPKTAGVKRTPPPVAARATTPSPTVRAAAPTTQRIEPSLPVALQEGGAAAVGTRLYEVGGYDENRKSTSDVFVFDGSSWHTGPALPIALNHPGVAAIGSVVYVVGGFTSPGASSRAFALHAGASTWSEVAPLRRARGALSLVAARGRLYALGGRSGNTQVAVPERYDPSTNAWTDLPPMPEPRNHGAGYVDRAKVCVAGGRTPATSAAVDCFDTNASTWSRVESLPVATSGASAAVLDGRLLVMGGEPSTETALVAVAQELRNGRWTTQPMLIPRHGAASAIYEGRLWQCGGASAPGFHAIAACTSTG